MVFGHGRGVKSHRLGRRRKAKSFKLPVAPWIVITVVSVMVLSTLVAVYGSLLRSGCSGSPYEVRIAASGNVANVLSDLGREWESTQPEFDGRCVGVDVEQVVAPTAAEALSSEWDETSLGQRPVAWVPDSVAWLHWAGGSQAVSAMVDGDPEVLAGSSAVIAAPDFVVEALGWNGDDPVVEPSWEGVAEAVDAGWSELGESDWGGFEVGVANPRSATAGLHALLSSSADEDGSVDADRVEDFNDVAGSGTIESSVEAMWRELSSLEAPGEVLEYASVFTALEHEVAAFNSTMGADFTMESVPLEGTRAQAQFPFLSLSGAGWTSEQDIAIAEEFREFLMSPEAVERFDSAGFRLPTEDDEETVESIHDEDGGSDSVVADEAVVSEVLQQWQALRRSINVLVVVDSSVDMGTEFVDVDGESLSAHEAAKRQVSALAEGLGSSSSMGLWDFSGDLGEESHWREGVALSTVDADQAQLLTDTSAGWQTQPTGSALYDTSLAAYSHMQSHYEEGAANVVVVLTNGGSDPVSAPTLEETGDELADLASDRAQPVRLVTVGVGDADESALSELASATPQGAFLEAGSPDDFVSQLRAELFH